MEVLVPRRSVEDVGNVFSFSKSGTVEAENQGLRCFLEDDLNLSTAIFSSAMSTSREKGVAGNWKILGFVGYANFESQTQKTCSL